MVSVRSTQDVGMPWINALLYGRSGIGKTVSLATSPLPIVISAEDGLASLSGQDVPFVKVRNRGDLQDVYRWLTTSEEGKQYETVCMDSLSAVCDIIYDDCRGRVGNNATVLYPELRIAVLPLITAFGGLSRHFVATAHETCKTTNQGPIITPSVVGGKLTDDLPYMFAQVLHYTVDAEDQRLVLTGANQGSIAKDRSGRLPARIIDPADIAKLFKYIIAKIGEQDG